MTLEVCVDSLVATRIAVEAGADRIELCSALETGGVTPSSALIRQVRSSMTLPLIVLIRCRTGDFVYDPSERELMLAEASDAFTSGADGIAVGGLLGTHELDLGFLHSIRQQHPSKQVVMHRAFDHVHDRDRALTQLIQLGFDRILTSGGAPTAESGISELAKLQSAAGDQLEILPAAGISDQNCDAILNETGCRQLHGSFRKSGHSGLPDPQAIRFVKQRLSSRICEF